MSTVTVMLPPARAPAHTRQAWAGRCQRYRPTWPGTERLRVACEGEEKTRAQRCGPGRAGEWAGHVARWLALPGGATARDGLRRAGMALLAGGLAGPTYVYARLGAAAARHLRFFFASALFQPGTRSVRRGGWTLAAPALSVRRRAAWQWGVAGSELRIPCRLPPRPSLPGLWLSREQPPVLARRGRALPGRLTLPARNHVRARRGFGRQWAIPTANQCIRTWAA